MLKKLVFSSMAIALSLITSCIKLWNMPMGGSVTLMSMFFVTLIGYWYGLKWGLTSAIAYGILQLLIDPYVISLPQLFLDYIFAFGALGLSGLFKNAKNGLYKGYCVSVCVRFVFSFISGVVYFGAGAVDFGLSVPVYSILYNGGYILPELALTLIIVVLPPVKSVLGRVEKMAKTI